MSDRVEQLITIGREHYQAREYERAEKYLSEVVEMRPTFPDVFNMLGVIFHSQGRFSEAEEAFENALRLNPNYTEAALNLSVTYNDRGKYDKAREVYSRVMSTSYDQPSSLDPFARGKIANMHADIGEVYSGFGLHDEAVREYSRALDLCPDFVDLRVRLGNVYRDMGLFNAAVAEFEHAKRLRPEYLPSRIYLGVTMFSLGRRDDAIREWQEVLTKDPENKNARLYLKMVKDEHVQAGSALARSDPEPGTS